MCVCKRNGCILCEGRIFSGLASDQVCRARDLSAHDSCPARAMLFHERASAGWLFILKSGCVKLTTTLSDGREQVLRLVLPGQMSGFEFPDENSYPYSACALTDVSTATFRGMKRPLELIIL